MKHKDTKFLSWGSFAILVCLLFFNPNMASSQDKNVSKVKDKNIQDIEIITPESANNVVAENESEELAEEIDLNLDNVDFHSSSEFVRLAWEASSQNNLERVSQLVDNCIKIYGGEAKAQQSQLTGFPSRDQVKKYQSLNDVGTCAFIKAEIFMNTGQTNEAIKQFQYIIDHFPWAQAWDPRGWYWSVTEKSKASIDVLTGKVEEITDQESHQVERTKPQLYTIGTQSIVDYTQFGEFQDAGTEKYHFKMKDPQGLSAAVGEGIYPNTGGVYNNPRYKIVKKEGRLTGSHWDYNTSDDLEAAYFKWFTAPEPWGVRMFYIGLIFEKAGMYAESIKAYHSLVVHFPKTVAWTYWQTPWYPAQAAIAKIRHILRTHPELNLQEYWMKIDIKNGFDNDVSDDIIITYPGKITSKGMLDKVKGKLHLDEKANLGKIIKKIGKGNVRLVQYENKHWQLLVENKPFVIKGITYAPTKIGQSPDKGTLVDWVLEDVNKNGKSDGPYDSWVDTNRNNTQDEDEPVVGDFQLMKDMGANTLRMYHQPFAPDKAFLREMYNKYGFRVIMGDFLGKYAIGSGATWSEGTDYENAEHRKNMLESVKKMVMQYKDEPYILMWVLGNENNYGVGSNADKKPEAYFKFVNEVALWIKSVDKNHPVSINNGDTLYLDKFAKFSPDVDIFTANVYRGNYGFGSFWSEVLSMTGKPAYISEYGCPAYAQHLTLEEAEEAQKEYLVGNWLDIEENIAGNARGVGNSLGGVVFEWMDEWWKSYEPYRHDRKSDAIGPFPGGYYFEEWFGIVGQGNGKHSPFMRQLRESYFSYKKLWNKH